jgi:hypothetical protein
VVRARNAVPGHQDHAHQQAGGGALEEDRAVLGRTPTNTPQHSPTDHNRWGSATADAKPRALRDGDSMKKKSRNLQKLTGSLGALQVLFKEILQEVPEEQAKRLIDGYHQGKTIELCIGQSGFGEDRKCAFGWRLSDGQKWRGLPEAVGGIQ